MVEQAALDGRWMVEVVVPPAVRQVSRRRKLVEARRRRDRPDARTVATAFRKEKQSDETK
jgi:hypothetical protein